MENQPFRFYVTETVMENASELINLQNKPFALKMEIAEDGIALFYFEQIDEKD